MWPAGPARARLRGSRSRLQEGELRVSGDAARERARPALRALLELPFELVIVSHGEPVHDRAAYERALELPM